MERGGEGQTIKPWFWIALLFLGSYFKTISDQYFLYIEVTFSRMTTSLLLTIPTEPYLRADTSHGHGARV